MSFSIVFALGGILIVNALPYDCTTVRYWGAGCEGVRRGGGGRIRSAVVGRECSTTRTMSATTNGGIIAITNTTRGEILMNITAKCVVSRSGAQGG